MIEAVPAVAAVAAWVDNVTNGAIFVMAEPTGAFVPPPM